VDGDAGNAYAWLALNAVMPPVVSLETFQGTYQAQENLRILAQLLPTSAPATLRERLAPYQPPRAAPPPLQITPEQRQQLDVLIAQRVAAFTQATPQTHRGQQLFTTHCTACHQIGGRGGLIGPQLDGIGTRGAARLTEDILDPNRNVDAHFHLHILTLKDGNHLSGFLKAEAGQVLILTDPAGQEQRVSKGDIVTDTVQPLSLMPSGFGQTLNEADFIDLLGWLLHQ
jgi:putative heme-binding domain-containing protein